MTSRVSPWFLLLVAVTVLGGALAADAGSPALLTTGVVLLVLGGWSVSLCLHEFGHAAVAYRGGDTSVREKGYLTLDIRRYTDVGLSFVLPVIFLLLGGFPLPGGAVWINRGAIRSRKMQSLVSLAGPTINLALGIGLATAVAHVSMPAGLAVGLSYLALVQVLAFVINILPVPGLDGFGALEPYLSRESQALAARVAPWATVALFVLLVGLPVLGQLFLRLGAFMFAMVGGDVAAALDGYSLLQFWR